MTFLHCRTSAAAVKVEPNHISELHTQLLFGHRALCLEDMNSYWIKIQYSVNDKPGFVLRHQFEAIEEEAYHALNYSLIEKTILAESNPLQFPGSYALEERIGDYFWDKNDRSKIQELLRSWITTPYFWGGLTPSGIDCSGLSKWLYGFYNISLPHSAADQMAFGEVIDFLAEARCGDLAFFMNEESEINHVGILLSPSEIIHASESNGEVVIDSFDQEGIINGRSGRRTHRLRVIKTLLH